MFERKGMRHINSILDEVLDHINEQQEPKVKQRTLTQNKSLHRYCELVALALNDAGLDMQTVLAEGTSIPWSAEKVKEDIWRTVQLAATGKYSTTDLTTVEVSAMFEIIHRHLASTFGITVHWPCEEMR